jgi:hypothetical protein
MLKARVTVLAVGVAESATRTLKLEVPAVVGVPLITPVLAFRFNPAGNEPLTTDHV